MTDTPVAYGYMRVHAGLGDDELRLMEEELSKYAEARGLELAHVLYEGDPGVSPDQLVRQLLRDDVRHVIVPSLEQITEHRIIGELLETAIEREAGAVLHETGAPSGDGHRSQAAHATSHRLGHESPGPAVPSAEQFVSDGDSVRVRIRGGGRPSFWPA